VRSPRRLRFRARFWAGLLAVAVVLTAAGFGVVRLRKAQAAANLPLAPAHKGEFLVLVRCRGEIQARRSVLITAPVNVPDLRIVWVAAAGSQVEADDVVVRFDPSSAKQQLQERTATLKQAQASLDQAVAQARITAEQDKRDLASARYDVELARMEASKREVVSVIDGETAKIDLALSEGKLRVREASVALHEVSSRAKLASLESVRAQAQADLELTQKRLAQMEIKTPISGVIVFMPNYSQGYMNAQPFKVGDQAWPGASVAEIPDLNTLEMEAKIEEIDRSRLAPGNEVRIHVDALPELSFSSKLALISPLTQVTYYEWPPTSSFRAYAKVEKPDPRLRPGMNGSVDVVVSRLKDTISIPAKALFTVRGRPVVYLSENKRYRPVEVQVLARNPDEIAVAGVPAGSMVTLTEPEMKERRQ
jgi:HlyD family secretion protein